MKKECQFILLSTEKISQIYIQHEKLYFEKYPVRSIYAGNQFLYILSDDEIKEGDKVFDVVGNKIIESPISMNPGDDWKKVIATTDPSLSQFQYTKEELDGHEPIKFGLPLISHSDIEYIISLYNEDKRVDIEVKANKWALDNADKTMETNSALNKGFKGGYNQCLQGNVDKKFTLEDIEIAIQTAFMNGVERSPDIAKVKKDIIQSLTKEQPKSDTVMVEYEEEKNYMAIYQPKLKDGSIVIHQ